MKDHKSTASSGAALRASIQDVEYKIHRRRAAIGIALGGVAHNVEKRIISPGTFITAGLLGAAVARIRHPHVSGVLSLLQTADTGLRLLQHITSRVTAMAT